MSKILTRLSIVLCTLFIVGGLAFGASEAFASRGTMECDEFGQPGTCPGEFTPVTCEQECQRLFGNSGACFMGCCNCLT